VVVAWVNSFEYKIGMARALPGNERGGNSNRNMNGNSNSNRP